MSNTNPAPLSGDDAILLALAEASRKLVMIRERRELSRQRQSRMVCFTTKELDRILDGEPQP